MSQETEYSIRGKCPRCGTAISLTSDGSDLLMFICEGCGNGLALYNGHILVVRASFLEKLNDRYRTRYCGRVESFDYTGRYASVPRGLPEQVAIEGVRHEDRDCLDVFAELDGLLRSTAR